MTETIRTIDARAVEHVDDNNLYVTSTIIDACNYDCQYCFNSAQRKDSKIDLKDFFQLLVKLRDENTTRTLNIVLIGGEPTLHQDLEWLCQKVDDELDNSEINICTNFTKPVGWYAKILKNCQKTNFILSWHSTRSDPINKSFLEKLKCLEALVEDKSRYEVLVMAETNNFENSLLALNLVKSICRRNNSSYPIVEFNLLKQTCSFRHKYTQDELMVFSKKKILNDDFHIVSVDGKMSKLRINDIVETDSFSFTGWDCDARKTNIYVHVDGQIYPCYGYYLAKKKPIAKLGQLDSSRILSDDLMKCQAPICGLDCCYTSKYKNTLENK